MVDAVGKGGIVERHDDVIQRLGLERLGYGHFEGVGAFEVGVGSDGDVAHHDLLLTLCIGVGEAYAVVLHRCVVCQPDFDALQAGQRTAAARGEVGNDVTDHLLVGEDFAEGAERAQSLAVDQIALGVAYVGQAEGHHAVVCTAGHHVLRTAQFAGEVYAQRVALDGAGDGLHVALADFTFLVAIGNLGQALAFGRLAQCAVKLQGVHRSGIAGAPPRQEHLGLRDNLHQGDGLFVADVGDFHCAVGAIDFGGVAAAAHALQHQFQGRTLDRLAPLDQLHQGFLVLNRYHCAEDVRHERILRTIAHERSRADAHGAVEGNREYARAGRTEQAALGGVYADQADGAVIAHRQGGGAAVHRESLEEVVGLPGLHLYVVGATAANGVAEVEGNGREHLSVGVGAHEVARRGGTDGQRAARGGGEVTGVIGKVTVQLIGRTEFHLAEVYGFAITGTRSAQANDGPQEGKE